MRYRNLGQDSRDIPMVARPPRKARRPWGPHSPREWSWGCSQQQSKAAGRLEEEGRFFVASPGRPLPRISKARRDGNKRRLPRSTGSVHTTRSPAEV